MPQIKIPDIGIPSGTLIIIAVIAIVYIIFKVFDISVKLFIKFLINALIGAALLFICNYAFNALHLEKLQVPINWITAALTGILGVPGVALIIIYNLFFNK